jgi:hypothetical protein
MILFDVLYRKYAEPEYVNNDNYGDGIVPGWSQLYPNIADQDQYPVHDGPSHLGETQSPRIGAKVEVVLSERLGIPRVNTWLGN